MYDICKIWVFVVWIYGRWCCVVVVMMKYGWRVFIWGFVMLVMDIVRLKIVIGRCIGFVCYGVVIFSIWSYICLVFGCVCWRCRVWDLFCSCLSCWCFNGGVFLLVEFVIFGLVGLGGCLWSCRVWSLFIIICGDIVLIGGFFIFEGSWWCVMVDGMWCVFELYV